MYVLSSHVAALLTGNVGDEEEEEADEGEEDGESGHGKHGSFFLGRIWRPFFKCFFLLAMYWLANLIAALFTGNAGDKEEEESKPK